LVQFVFYY